MIKINKMIDFNNFMEKSLKTKGIFLVTLAALLWGVSGTVAQYLFQSKNFTPEWLVVIRMLCAGVLLITMGLIKGDKNIFKIWSRKENIIKLVLFGLLGMLGMQYTYFAAIKHGNAASATILQYLAPIIITVYLSLRNKKLPTLKQIICVSMAMLGTFLIITKGNINSLSISKLAVFWGIASAFASAIYTLQPVSLVKEYGSTSVVGWGMIIGGVAFSFINSPFNCSGNWSLKAIAAIVFVVIFGTLIAFYCYLESLRYIKPEEASILACVEPLSAALLSIIFLSLKFSFVEWIGTLCIIITVSILSFNKNDNDEEYVEFDKD